MADSEDPAVRAALKKLGMDEPAASPEDRQRNADDFVRLWTAASRAKAYDKEAWKAVERQLVTAGLI